MDDALKKALERRTKLQSEIALIDQYIELHTRIFGEIGAIAADDAAPAVTLSDTVEAEVRPSNNTKAIGDGIEAILARSDWPVQRGKLISGLEADGLPIHSKDKSKYIGTILWRNRERFVNIEGEGYWLRSRPLPDRLKHMGPLFEMDSDD